MFPDLTRDDVFRLETRRLWLRWPRGADAAAIARFAGEKAVAEMTASIPHPLSPEAAIAFVLQSRRDNLDGHSLTMAIAPRAKPGDLIGIVSIGPSIDEGRPELGYWIGTPHWDQGFATEAARSMVDAFFAYTNGRELTSWARVVNPASRRVLETCGFAALGSELRAFPARGGAFPVHRFALDRRRWQTLRAGGVRGYVPDRPLDAVAASCGGL